MPRLGSDEVERVMGIEPTLVAWEATVLPLNYTRSAARFYAPGRLSGNCSRSQTLRFDLRDLELFVAVADAGSIARAAERSHTVASAVSKRISDLEESFGSALLVRGAKGVELTAAGHALLARARVLLHQATQLDDEMRRHASGRAWLRARVREHFGDRGVPAGALASFAAQHPDIHVHLEEHVSSAIAAAVADNSADFGIVSELPVIDGLTTLPFRNDELVLVLQPDHPLARRKSIAFADIANGRSSDCTPAARCIAC